MPEHVTAIAHYITPDPTKSVQLAFAETGLYARQLTAPDFVRVYDFQTPSPLPWRFVHMDKKLICFSPVPGESFAVDAEGLSLGPFLPPARTVAVHQERLCAARLPDHPNRIVFSDPQSPSEWHPRAYLDFGTDDQPITALVVIAGVLYVFKRNAMYAVYGHDITNWTVELISDSVGCTAPDSVQVIDHKVYFVHNDRVYRFDGTTFDILSQPIRPLLPHASMMRAVKSAATDDMYYLAYPDGTEWNSCILVFDTVNEAWMLDTGPSVLSFASLRIDGTPELVAYDPITCFLYRLEAADTDDGAPIEANFQSHRLALPEATTFQARRLSADIAIDGEGSIEFTVRTHVREYVRQHTVRSHSSALPAHLWGDALTISCTLRPADQPIVVNGVDVLVDRRLRPS